MASGKALVSKKKKRKNTSKAKRSTLQKKKSQINLFPIFEGIMGGRNHENEKAATKKTKPKDVV